VSEKPLTTSVPTVRRPQRPAWGSRLAAEAAGTFILVFAVVGTGLFAAGFGQGDGGLNVGFLGVALALGLSVVVGAAAFGHVSGGHFNPAVTVGLAVAGRFPWREVGGHIVAQVVGAVLATSVLAGVAAGGPRGFLADAQQAGFVSIGAGPLSPGGFSVGSVILVEAVCTMIFVLVILGVTGARPAVPYAPVVIGLTLTVLALVSIPVSDTSLNPARALASALYGGPDALSQVWLGIVAPLLGAVVAGLVHPRLFGRARD
jgi:aquaporin Z